MPRPKIYCDGTWTAARKHAFIKNALRAALLRWPPKHQCIKAAYVEDGVNPETNRKCKLHRCAECKGLYPKKDIRADHIVPIVPVTGFKSWDETIERAFVEADRLQALCVTCHKIKSDEERKERLKQEKKIDRQ